MPERLAKVVVEVREEPQVGRDCIEIAQMQPLGGEAGREALRARIGEQAAHLLLEDVGLVEFAALGQVEKLVVGNAAPEEERKTRREIEVADSVSGLRGDAGRILLDEKQELRIDEDAAQGCRDACFEVSL